MRKRTAICLFLLAALSARAQTGGPGQPEFMQFKPVTASNLVNVSSGSFSYNIPLFEIGGYPCNLSYQSGAQMDEVASTVGLGWNLNIGAITHTMRGLPDDFKGDPITRTIYMKPNITMGGNFNLSLEVIGFPFVGVNGGMGIFYNSLNGFGLERSYGISFSASNSSNTASVSLGLGMKANSQSGVDLYAQPSVSLASAKGSSMAANGSIGGNISINSREGLKASVNSSMSMSTNINRAPPASFSASYSFSKSAEIPRISYPFITTSYTGSIKGGGEIFFLHPNLALSGYYTKQELSTNVINTPSYGFLYADQSLAAGGNVLLDFNREKDQPYIKDVSKNIGIPYYTNDIYSVNAQGISGSFQLNRNDIGVIFDNKVMSSSTAVNIGLEVGAGNAVHVGADLSTTFNSSSSGKWATGVTPYLDFKSSAPGKTYEPAYFKNAADLSIDVNSLYSRLIKDEPVKVGLHTTGATSVDMSNMLTDRHSAQVPLLSSVNKQVRDPRTINIQYLTAAQADKYGVDKTISQYKVNGFDCKQTDYKTEVSRTSGYRQLHHISEMTATNVDGMRYVFGLPTYNITQEEVSYTLATTQTSNSEGQVTYANASWGTNGKDGFYEKTSTPAYVTSNLLTAVLSPDYNDVDNNGPSINDAGNYVKFNYINAGVFTWRTPYEQDKATFNKAFLSDPTDNKASYVLGTKELWYIHSIESKTEIAEFYYDTNRLDGMGAVDNKKLHRLTEIRVFSKNERILKGTSAIATRIIKLSQDYDLCPGTKNSAHPGKGKLTLKQVAMYSGKSMRALQSPYKFTYGEMPSGAVINPAYNPRFVNRWGNYQENANPDIQASSSAIAAAGSLSNADFPYSNQDVVAMTQNAYAWNLTKIQLPSGGAISVVYEPHHYAYTQDQRNMEMMPILGIGASPALANNADLYVPNSSTSNLFLKFKLKSPISGSATYNQLLYQYFNQTSLASGTELPQYFYYKTLVRLRADRDETWDWVSGYARIKSVGLINSNYAYIELKPVCINDKSESSCPIMINPIAKSAFQFIRMNRSGLGYGTVEEQPLPGNVTLEDFLTTDDLTSKVSDQSAAFRESFNKYAMSRNFAYSVALNKSFIRLYSPGQDKIIGGSRVKTIVTSDNWGQGSKNYTTDYEYTLNVKNPVSNLDEVISSGVTEYEPMIGGDENPLHQPDFYDQQIKMAPDNNLYVDLPYNESLFPAPNLVYSNVKVTSNKTTLAVPGTGYQVHEFFTAKDYPIKTDLTEIGDNFEKKTSMLQGLTASIMGSGMFHDYVTLSQGFAIVLNNMHGKTRSTQNYNTQGVLVSGESFDYALNKDLQLVSRNDLIYQSDQLGVSVSAICDARTSEHETKTFGVDLNLDFTMLSIVPSIAVVPIPKAIFETIRLNSVSVNKIVHKNGILVKRTVTENGASVSTENLLFDEKTGDPLLTRTTNEFSDYIYSFHYPAHWIYPGMSAGYVSPGITLTVSSNILPINDPDVLSALNLGDEMTDATGNRLWIMSKNNTSITLSPATPGASAVAGQYTLLRPGRKNLLNEEAGTVVTNYYPVRNNKLYFTAAPTLTDSTGILNASMKEYADKRVKLCECDTKGPVAGSQAANTAVNPYLTGELGNWYPLKTWSRLAGRTRSTAMTGNQTNLRKDGIFTSYSNFFKPPQSPGGFWTTDALNWQWVETITLKDVNGLTLETKDPLNRYNAMLTGYKQKMIVAEAGNARQNEVLYDGFEDSGYLPYSSNCDQRPLCNAERINWNNLFSLAQDQSHSGKYSGELTNPSTQIAVPLNTKDCDIVIPGGQHSSTCCTGVFRPEKGKKYILSAWVREMGNDLAYTFTAPSIMAGNATFNTSGNIIDGWQRIYGEFTIPSGAANLTMKFNKGSNRTFFDDIRIYPADAKMATYVYDRNTLKLTFSSDENNYFTKYNYDGEDNLQSVNKETEQGVQTVKESRSSNRKMP